MLKRYPSGATGRGWFSRFYHKLSRRKEVGGDHMQTELKRCLTTFDITLLGIGHMMGSGIYVLTPTVAHDKSGPAIVISYLIAGVASLLAALAYAEFGVKFPRAGSAYSYSYFSVGEFWAFFVGWNVLLENVIGISAVSRACSAYLDSLTNGAIKAAITNITGPINVPFMSQHLDFLALAIIIVYVVFMSFGVHATSRLNNILCCVNIAVLIVIIGVGAYFADINNWTNPQTGGFMPYGWQGVFGASATCFFAYVGFDAIASSGEEAKTPQKSLPIATFLSMGIVTVLYICVSAVLTMMVNYQDITKDSGLPDALAFHGAIWAKYVVIIGALCGMSTVLIGTLYALTRVAYAMADDGLIHRVFGIVHKKSHIPLFSMYAFSALAAVLAVILDIEILVEMMSIGTLFAYLVVSGGVIIFRYTPPQQSSSLTNGEQKNSFEMQGGFDYGSGVGESGRYKMRWSLTSCFGNASQTRVISTCVVIIVAATFFAGFWLKYVDMTKWFNIFILVASIFVILVVTIVIWLHNQTPSDARYKMPLVPLLPILSMVTNAFLMTTLQPLTWARLLIWVAIGLTGYFIYGTRHSKLNALDEKVPISSAIHAQM